MAIGTIRLCPADPSVKKERPEKTPKPETSKRTERKNINLPHIDFEKHNKKKIRDDKTKSEETKLAVKEPVLNYTPNEGMDNISIAVVAENKVSAKDFVCGMYCNLLDFSRGSQLSVYVRERKTLNMLTETKQYLEEVISNPKNTKIKCSEEMAEVDNYVIVMGEAANQKLTLNLNISCYSYDNIGSATQADAVFVILNKSDATVTKETFTRLSNSLPGKKICWVITGFERENVYYSSDLDVPPSDVFRRRTEEFFGMQCKNGDSIYFAQQYGGLVVEETEGSVPVYTTVPVCRDYVPAACCLPVIYSVLDICKACTEKSVAIETASRMIIGIISSTGAVSDSWRREFIISEE